MEVVWSRSSVVVDYASNIMAGSAGIDRASRVSFDICGATGRTRTCMNPLAFSWFEAKRHTVAF